MEDLSNTTRRELTMRLPAALEPHITCFALSDEHPSDQRPYDVVVCTCKGEVLELYRRQVTASTRLGDGLIPREITIYRNKEALKFYLVSAFDSLHIISAWSNLEIYKHIENVDRFVIDDPFCKGTACIRLWYSDDAVPIVLDENFVNTGDILDNDERQCHSTGDSNDNGSAFVASLRSKLAEARHMVAVNKRRHKELLRFRQTAAHTMLQDVCPNSVDSAFQSCQKVHEAMGVIGPAPWLKFCNRKVVLGATVCNETDSQTFSDIKLYLQCDTGVPLVYHTQLFSSLSSTPFWESRSSAELPAKSRASIVAVADLPEFTICNQIQFKGVIIYWIKGSQKFLPLETKILSILDTLNESFDLLSSKDFDYTSLLAIIASTEGLNLKVLHVRALSDITPPDIISIFIQHLKMERVSHTDNILIHRSSPYHVLYGVMISVNESRNDGAGISYDITVFLRCKSQLSSLLHLIYDEIPHRLVVSIPEATVLERKSANLNKSVMDIDGVTRTPDNRSNERCLMMAHSLLVQMTTVLQYLDECMVSMAASKNSELVNLIGTKIDFNCSGPCRYADFVCRLNDEIRRGNKLLN